MKFKHAILYLMLLPSIIFIILLVLFDPIICIAGTYFGNPSNYVGLLMVLQPGDTLILSPGSYDANGLPVFDLNGTPESPITIMGPEQGPMAVILGHANQNTVRLGNSSHVVIKNLEIDGRNLGGDTVNGQQTTHHIALENLHIHGCSDDQQTVGISTNSATVWNWTIRRSTITDCGTGMYLGNSDGSEPFIAGLIEYNLIYDTIGYNIEIKHQNPRPTIASMPTGDSTTIIRNNVFSKANNGSTGTMIRPNLLVGHFPLSGPGMNDVYQIYGNFFYQNPSGEPLFQGEGNIALYNNLLVNTNGDAILIQPHNDVPRMVRVFNNTIVASGAGIKVSGGSPLYQQKVIGNAIFASTPIQATDQKDNITDLFLAANIYLANPFGKLGQLDLFPKLGMLTGKPIDTSFFQSFIDWNRDFNNYLHNSTFRGAYAGEGQNPGWLPKLEIKPAGIKDIIPPLAPSGLKVQ